MFPLSILNLKDQSFLQDVGGFEGAELTEGDIETAGDRVIELQNPHDSVHIPPISVEVIPSSSMQYLLLL